MHFAYCKHRWGRIFLDNEWETNSSVLLGDILHEKVHNPFKDDCRGKKKIVRSMPLFNKDYGLFGVADCVEFFQNNKGVFINELNGYYVISVIEYKNGKPCEKGIKYSDKIQLAAQMLCIEYMFKTKPSGYLYYGKVKRRSKFDDYGLIKEKLFNLISEINYYRKLNLIPFKDKEVKCEGCSFSDKCLPKIKLDLKVKDLIFKSEKTK